MIRINQIKASYKEDAEKVIMKTLKKLHIQESEVLSYQIFKKSIDARKKDQILFVYAVDVVLKNELNFLKKNRNKNIQQIKEKHYRLPEKGDCAIDQPIVIAGSGPAGLFCGLILAREGYKPIIIERGASVDERQQIVHTFWETGVLDEATNVQFGEGGAGTFSDGKLNTLIKDPVGRHKKVLELFVEYGADPEILYTNKPHIGTDVLCAIVKRMREDIISMGGEVRFLSKLTDLQLENNRIQKICINDSEWMSCEALVLAIGHSARDTFKMLDDKKFQISPKPFAIGLRIEHPQRMINQAQYGIAEDEILGSAPYKLTCRTSNGRSVYTFCMCPGGYVVNASSEDAHCVVNGMSYHDRDSANANSAVVVSVTPEDFPSEDVLAGVEFQRHWEHLAYTAGAGKIPVQLFGDFKSGRKSVSYGEILPVHRGMEVFADLNECLPDYVCDSLKEGITAFGHKIPGFDREDALLCGVETRTSSPIRIERDEQFMSNYKGVYPCGEGAGYAGGITSAAMDGLKIAEALIKKYKSVI